MTLRGPAIALSLLTCGGFVGCATTNAASDPWERVNRGTFAFNEIADEWVVAPAARAWDFVLPDVVETGIDNFFENSRAPVDVFNNVLQGEFEEGYLQAWRFVLNTSFGIAGLIDVASMAAWPDHPEDFGLTLATWGVSHGPYLVLPVLGASSVRDTVGLGFDAGVASYSYFVPFYVPIAARAIDLLNQRAIFYEEIEQSREEAFDFYVFVRSAYLQNREHRLEGRPAGGTEEAGPASPEEDDLYYFEDEFEDDFEDEVD
ncbi:MAG: VacJ family lipoprotein [Myxococcota bacterium]|nr:VacJ family lipoprotein [Myxococcota bacterium]